MEQDEKFMREALREAREALAAGEIPIGAVITSRGRIIGRGHHKRCGGPHGEIEAFLSLPHESDAAGADLYVTLEPCAMCAGALIWARMESLVIGTMDPKAGACGSLMDIVEDDRLNHVVSVTRGVLQDECAALLKQFFSNLRR